MKNSITSSDVFRIELCKDLFYLTFYSFFFVRVGFHHFFARCLFKSTPCFDGILREKIIKKARNKHSMKIREDPFLLIIKIKCGEDLMFKSVTKNNRDSDKSQKLVFASVLIQRPGTFASVNALSLGEQLLFVFC